ncbi:OLC1v1018008C1 [Oldenlandia corymbosa var. corymbosa]|uniref:OLC1v1018008C1 n=1 Tax=Oldenlandia corymbosa var. corymbosa TaxID=529605 RepID=A0AAV1EAQ5_OLDCO|nr:OLC1v1018008C1 [Oldenlandia corymbosa var. corymbosa]
MADYDLENSLTELRLYGNTIRRIEGIHEDRLRYVDAARASNLYRRFFADVARLLASLFKRHRVLAKSQRDIDIIQELINRKSDWNVQVLISREFEATYIYAAQHADIKATLFDPRASRAGGGGGGAGFERRIAATLPRGPDGTRGFHFPNRWLRGRGRIGRRGFH